MSGCRASAAVVVIVYCMLTGCGLPPVNPPPVGDTDGYKTFFVGEQNIYPSPQGDCESEEHIDITTDAFVMALRTRVPAWQGVHATDLQPACMEGKCAEPSDYVEGSYSWPEGTPLHGLKGEDHLWGDSRTISVFSGHGAHDALSFRRPTVTPDGSGRLHATTS